MSGEDISGRTIQLVAQTPLDDETLVKHVKHSLSLGLNELRDFEYPHAEVMTLVANGPSASRAPLAKLGPTCALNGALKLFTARGLAPTYAAVCDPMEMVATFFENAPAETHYLVASKCHPRVFDTLMRADRKITVWHIDDFCTWPLLHDRFPVRTAVSVTLTIFEVLERLGWRGYRTWGWDGCFLDGLGHSAPQEENTDAITVEIGSRTFTTTATHVLEAETAAAKMADFRWPLEIMGGGMIGAFLQATWSARINEMLLNRAKSAA